MDASALKKALDWLARTFGVGPVRLSWTLKKGLCK